MARGRRSTEELVLRPGDDGARGPRPAQPRDLLCATRSDALPARWRGGQARSGEGPQGAARDGDSPLAGPVERLAASSARCEDGGEQQWRSGGEPGADELPVAPEQDRSSSRRPPATERRAVRPCPSS